MALRILFKETNKLTKQTHRYRQRIGGYQRQEG